MITVELKPNWYVRLPYPMTERDMFFYLHKWRFDPVTILAGTMVGGGIISAVGAREEGKMAKKIGEARAAIAEKEAKAVERQAAEEAKIEEERKIRLIAAQKMGYAAGNVRLDIGAPLLLEAQTRADFGKEKEYILETGRERAESLRMQAAYERAYGKARKKQSRWRMFSSLLSTGAGVGLMGYQMGWFGGAGAGAGVGVGGERYAGAARWERYMGWR